MTRYMTEEESSFFTCLINIICWLDFFFVLSEVLTDGAGDATVLMPYFSVTLEAGHFGHTLLSSLERTGLLLEVILSGTRADSEREYRAPVQ